MEPQIDISNYECSICQLIYTNPCKLLTCLHIFCQNCIGCVIEHQDLRCPMCKAKFSPHHIKPLTKMNEELNTKFKTCECKAKIKLSEWNDHYSSCEKVKQNIKSSIASLVVPSAKETVNRSTFKCPLCDLANFDRESLLKHVNKFHKNKQAVCPICVCQPWGDPNYVTTLSSHMNLRHRFDYDTIVDYNEDEDLILEQVLLNSMK